MAVKFDFAGRKGQYKVVKTIDVCEESYEALQKMVLSGKNMTEDVCLPLIEDTYQIFGGNCYGMLVSMAIEHLIGGVVHKLEEKDFLSMSGEKAFATISDAVLPSMCYIADEDGAVEDELRFFESDMNEIIGKVTPCLAEKQQRIFSGNLKEAVKQDARPVGEIALGILMFISSETCQVDDDEGISN